MSAKLIHRELSESIIGAVVSRELNLSVFICVIRG